MPPNRLTPERIDALRLAILRAGRSALDAQPDMQRSSERKGDGSPVTALDRAVETALREETLRLFPDALVLGEEAGLGEATDSTIETEDAERTDHSSEHSSAREPASPRVVIDPIDGTRAYIRGLDTWSVLYAIEVPGEGAYAFAYLPGRDHLYEGDGTRTRRGDREVRLKGAIELDASLVQHGSLGQFADADLLTWLPTLAKASYTQRGFSDFAGYAEVLEGRADLMVDPSIQVWDVKAPMLLIEGAGGHTRLATVGGSLNCFAGREPALSQCIAALGL